jgi:hypothetical protein
VLKDFGDTAKGLARNPLGIIALFIALIYGFACLVLGLSNNLTAQERWPIVWFLVVFPVGVFFAFCWLVSQHHQKLYAPKDFSSDEAFLQGISARATFRRDVIELEQEIQSKVQQKLSSPQFGSEFSRNAKQAAEEVNKVIRQSSSLTVDTQKFANGGVHTFPIAAFPTFGDILDEVFFLIHDHVSAYEYGYSWVLKHKRLNATIKGSRMITGSPPGEAITDMRALSEVDITAGDELEVLPLTVQKRTKRNR